MSEQTYLIVAVVATFVTVLLVATRMVVTSPNRRAASVLQAHLESVGAEVARRPGVSGSLGDRVVTPTVHGMSSWVGRITPTGMRDGIATKLALAGNPYGMSAELFLTIRAAATVGGLLAGYYLGVKTGPHLLGSFWIPLLGYLGYLFPGTWLDGRARQRQDAIRRDLADMIDLLTISVEAGLSLNAAIAQVVQNVPGVLSQEFARMLQEIQLGVPRSEAFRHLAERTDVEELNSFALAMIQADVFGVSIASVLRTQASQLRIKRRQAAEAKAQQTPVKIVFPLILCILPALFVVIIGPGFIRIMESLFK